MPARWARQISVEGWGNSGVRGEESGGSLGKPWLQPLSTPHRLLKGLDTFAISLAGAGSELGSLKAEAFVPQACEINAVKKGSTGPSSIFTL